MGLCATRTENPTGKFPEDDLVNVSIYYSMIITHVKSCQKKVISLTILERYSSEEDDYVPQFIEYENVKSSYKKKPRKKSSKAINSFVSNKENMKFHERNSRGTGNSKKIANKTLTELVIMADAEDDIEEMRRNILAMRKVSKRYVTEIRRRKCSNDSDES